MSAQAKRDDELEIRTDDELEVLEWDDGDGWTRGRNSSGHEGYFPQSYVKASNSSPQRSPLQSRKGSSNKPGV